MGPECPAAMVALVVVLATASVFAVPALAADNNTRAYHLQQQRLARVRLVT